MFVNKIAYDPVGYVSYRDYMFMASKLNYRLQTMIRYDRLEQAAMTEDAMRLLGGIAPGENALSALLYDLTQRDD